MRTGDQVLSSSGKNPDSNEKSESKQCEQVQQLTPNNNNKQGSSCQQPNSVESKSNNDSPMRIEQKTDSDPYEVNNNILNQKTMIIGSKVGLNSQMLFLVNYENSKSPIWEEQAVLELSHRPLIEKYLLHQQALLDNSVTKATAETMAITRSQKKKALAKQKKQQKSSNSDNKKDKTNNFSSSSNATSSEEEQAENDNTKHMEVEPAILQENQQKIMSSNPQKNIIPKQPQRSFLPSKLITKNQLLKQANNSIRNFIENENDDEIDDFNRILAEAVIEEEDNQEESNRTNNLHGKQVIPKNIKEQSTSDSFLDSINLKRKLPFISQLTPTLPTSAKKLCKEQDTTNSYAFNSTTIKNQRNKTIIISNNGNNNSNFYNNNNINLNNDNNININNYENNELISESGLNNMSKTIIPSIISISEANHNLSESASSSNVPSMISTSTTINKTQSFQQQQKGARIPTNHLFQSVSPPECKIPQSQRNTDSIFTPESAQKSSQELQSSQQSKYKLDMRQSKLSQSAQADESEKLFETPIKQQLFMAASPRSSHHNLVGLSVVEQFEQHFNRVLSNSQSAKRNNQNCLNVPNNNNHNPTHTNLPNQQNISQNGDQFITPEKNLKQFKIISSEKHKHSQGSSLSLSQQHQKTNKHLNQTSSGIKSKLEQQQQSVSSNQSKMHSTHHHRSSTRITVQSLFLSTPTKESPNKSDSKRQNNQLKQSSRKQASNILNQSVTSTNHSPFPAAASFPNQIKSKSELRSLSQSQLNASVQDQEIRKKQSTQLEKQINLLNRQHLKSSAQKHAPFSIDKSTAEKLTEEQIKLFYLSKGSKKSNPIEKRSRKFENNDDQSSDSNSSSSDIPLYNKRHDKMIDERHSTERDQSPLYNQNSLVRNKRQSPHFQNSKQKPTTSEDSLKISRVQHKEAETDYMKVDFATFLQQTFSAAKKYRPVEQQKQQQQRIPIQFSNDDSSNHELSNSNESIEPVLSVPDQQQSEKQLEQLQQGSRQLSQTIEQTNGGVKDQNESNLNQDSDLMQPLKDVLQFNFDRMYQIINKRKWVIPSESPSVTTTTTLAHAESISNNTNNQKELSETDPAHDMECEGDQEKSTNSIQNLFITEEKRTPKPESIQQEGKKTEKIHELLQLSHQYIKNSSESLLKNSESKHRNIIDSKFEGIDDEEEEQKIDRSVNRSCSSDFIEDEEEQMIQRQNKSRKEQDKGIQISNEMESVVGSVETKKIQQKTKEDIESKINEELSNNTLFQQQVEEDKNQKKSIKKNENVMQQQEQSKMYEEDDDLDFFKILESFEAEEKKKAQQMQIESEDNHTNDISTITNVMSPKQDLKEFPIEERQKRTNNLFEQQEIRYGTPVSSKNKVQNPLQVERLQNSCGKNVPAIVEDEKGKSECQSVQIEENKVINKSSIQKSPSTQLGTSLKSSGKKSGNGGTYENGDKPKRIITCRPCNNEIFVDIEWEARADGHVPKKSTVNSKIVREFNHHLLLDFYESKIKFTTNSVQKKKTGITNKNQQESNADTTISSIEQPSNLLVSPESQSKITTPTITTPNNKM